MRGESLTAAGLAAGLQNRIYRKFQQHLETTKPTVSEKETKEE